jgi:hypothetical protein
MAPGRWRSADSDAPTTRPVGAVTRARWLGGEAIWGSRGTVAHRRGALHGGVARWNGDRCGWHGQAVK